MIGNPTLNALNNYLKNSNYSESWGTLSYSELIAANLSAQHINQLLVYFNATTEYTNITSISAPFSDTSTNTVIVASGNLVLNNLTHSYNFELSNFNGKYNSSFYLSMKLSRQTSKQIQTSTASEDWTNTTRLSEVTYSESSNSNSKTISSGYICKSQRFSYFFQRKF